MSTTFQIRKVTLPLLIVFMTTLAGCMEVMMVSTVEEAVAAKREKALLDVDPKYFPEWIKKTQGVVFVKLYAPWCEICKEIEPYFWRLGYQDKSALTVAKVDADNNKKFHEKYRFSGFPHFLVFRDGKQIYSYGGVEGFRRLKLIAEEMPVELPEFGSMSQQPVAAKTSHVLIAAGSDVANFGQEIVELYDEFRSKGVPAAEIACYFVAPDLYSYLSDRKQFDEIRPKLERCRLLDLASFRQDVQKIADKGGQPLFVYITSHGLSRSMARKFFNMAGERENLPSEKVCREFLDYQLLVDSGRYDNKRIIGQVDTACMEGPDQNVVITPRFLHDSFAHLDKTRKIFVLQGCYSGGFIRSGIISPDKPTLRNLANTTILTASHHERTSFGCNPGSVHTYYGEALLQEIKQVKPGWSPGDVQKLHERILQAVAKKEEETGFVGKEASLPQIYPAK